MRQALELEERKMAQRSTRNFALLIALASFANLARWFYIGIMPEWPWVITTLAAFTGSSLMAASKTKPHWMNCWVYFTCLVLMLLSLAHTNWFLAQAGSPFSPFAGFKLAAIAVAVFAPIPAWFGYASIAACGLIPVLMYYTVLAPYQSAMTFQEPWLTLMAVLVSFSVLFYRIRSIELEKSYARLKAEKKNLDEVARIFLALRDLTNTPLQTIRIAANLLETNSLSPAEAAHYLKGPLDRLTELTRLLAYYEQDREFVSKYESFDAVIFLEQKLAALKAQAHHQKEEIL